MMGTTKEKTIDHFDKLKTAVAKFPADRQHRILEFAERLGSTPFFTGSGTPTETLRISYGKTLDEARIAAFEASKRDHPRTFHDKSWIYARSAFIAAAERHNRLEGMEDVVNLLFSITVAAASETARMLKGDAFNIGIQTSLAGKMMIVEDLKYNDKEIYEQNVKERISIICEQHIGLAQQAEGIFYAFAVHPDRLPVLLRN